MRFLCLHGRATCAKFFEMQTARIREELVDHDFVFLNGSICISMQSGDNGAITAASAEDTDGGQYGYIGELTDMNQHQNLLDGLVEAVQIQGPFEGVMGFSEGGVVAATLLVEDARRPFANFKCGILFSAAPPLDPDDLRAGIIRCLDPAVDGVSIHVPTAHIYSHENSSTGTGFGFGNVESPLNKLWSDAGWSRPEQVHTSLARLCDKSQVFVHDHGHQVPGPRDRQALRGAFRAINRTIESVDSR